MTSALDGGEWSSSRPGHFTSRERATGTQWIGGWVGPRTGPDAVVKRELPAPVGIRTLDHPARSPEIDNNKITDQKNLWWNTTFCPHHVAGLMPTFPCFVRELKLATTRKLMHIKFSPCTRWLKSVPGGLSHYGRRRHVRNSGTKCINCVFHLWNHSSDLD
jgi:hypothetical protein